MHHRPYKPAPAISSTDGGVIPAEWVDVAGIDEGDALVLTRHIDRRALEPVGDVGAAGDLSA
jgi:hypothetical protein